MTTKKQTVCQAHRENFETLKRAFKANSVCLIETQLVESGEVVACLATVARDDDGSIIITPFCIFLNGNPYTQLRPPKSGR